MERAGTIKAVASEVACECEGYTAKSEVVEVLHCVVNDVWGDGGHGHDEHKEATVVWSLRGTLRGHGGRENKGVRVGKGAHRQQQQQQQHLRARRTGRAVRERRAASAGVRRKARGAVAGSAVLTRTCQSPVHRSACEWGWAGR